MGHCQRILFIEGQNLNLLPSWLIAINNVILLNLHKWFQKLLKDKITVKSANSNVPVAKHLGEAPRAAVERSGPMLRGLPGLKTFTFQPFGSANLPEKVVKASFPGKLLTVSDTGAMQKLGYFLLYLNS